MSVDRYLNRNSENHLTLHKVDLVELCHEHYTPLFIFDEASLKESYERFHSAFQAVYPKTMICYSIKTNNNLAVCRILRESGAHAEVSSELDLHIALKSGFTGDRIIYDGPYKPKEALERAVDNNILLINLESFKEMEILNNIAKEKGIEQPVGLRVNPFKPPGFPKVLHINNLLEAGYCYPVSRFGFSINQTRKAFDHLTKLTNLRLKCLLTHPFTSALRTLPAFMKEANEYGHEIEYLNFGGGFSSGVTGYTGDFPLMTDFLRRKLGLKPTLNKKKTVSSIESIAKTIVEGIRMNLGKSTEPTLITEPGSYLVGPSGILLIRVDHVKKSGEWVVTDGGTNILPVIYERHEIRIANRIPSSIDRLTNVVGPLLYPKDFIAIKTRLPEVKHDDLLAVLHCGAYSISSSTQFLYPRPAVLLVNSQGITRVIRKRETFEDVSSKDRS